MPNSQERLTDCHILMACVLRIWKQSVPNSQERITDFYYCHDSLVFALWPMSNLCHGADFRQIADIMASFQRVVRLGDSIAS